MTAFPQGPTILSDSNFRTMSVGLVDMNDKTLINLADPVDAQDAATKSYVDLVITGTTNTLPYFTGSGLGNIPYSSVNPVSGIVTISRINLTGYGDTALTSQGLVQGTTMNAKLLTSSNNGTYAFTANSFFAPKIGFFNIGTNPIVQQTLTVGDSTLDDVINFLKAYGLSA